MTRSIKHVFSKELVSVLLKNKILAGARKSFAFLLNRQGKKDHTFSSKRLQNNQNKRENRSQYGIRLREFKKIMVLYGNLSKGYLKKKIKLFHNTPTKTEESFFRYLESRLDVVLCRASFFDSISSAKQAIQSGGVQVNQITVTTPAQILKPGDIVNLIEKTEASYYPNKEIVEQESAFFFKKVERIICKKGNDKKRKALSFQKLIPLILFSTREEKISLPSPLHKIKKLSTLSREIKKSEAFLGQSPFGQSPLWTSPLEKEKESLVLRKRRVEVLSTTVEESHKKIARAEIVSNTLSPLFAKVIESQKNINLWKGIKTSNFPNYAKKIFRHNFSTDLDAASTLSLETRSTKITSLDVSSTILESALRPFEKKKEKADSSLSTCNNGKPFQQDSDKFYPDYTNRDYCIVLTYYLHLRRVLEKNHTIKQAYLSKDRKIFEKGRPAHLEISYTSLSVVFLFPPQLIRFSDFVNFSKIFR